ncbi:hypothetical protein CDAR_17511, partial [Caerostris darwini]
MSSTCSDWFFVLVSAFQNLASHGLARTIK